MKKYRFDALAISFICILVCIFFARLFYPEPLLIVTPDYGRSDAWHFSFPTKYALSQSLHTMSLPLWRSDIGAGFPLFAEGQTGALFIPNIILFRLLSPALAYNAALVLCVASLGVGMYILFRALRLSRMGSLFSAISIMFSGLTLTQLPHITLLQGTSLLPFVMAISIWFIEHPTARMGGLLAFVISQQIFAGFPQATFLTLIISGCIVFWHALQKKRWWISLMTWLVYICIGIAAGAIQMLPSYEFLRAGTDPKGFTPANATAYSMPVKHLMSFIDPFYFGNPALGTYPPFYAFDGSIFWENTAYMGILPIVLLIGSILILKKHTGLTVWWGFLIITITLAAGKFGPAYILFSVWPLTLFRVPSRFLWLSMIAISYISGFVITTVQQKNTWRVSIRFLLILLLFGHTAALMRTWWGYHLMEPSRIWLAPPKTVSMVAGKRILTIGEPKLHNDVMIKTGWTNPERFHSLRIGLSPDANMIWNISQYHVYAGRFLNRPTITETLLSESIETDRKTATISAARTLSLFSVQSVISYVPVESDELQLEHESADGDVNVYMYTNPKALPRAYLVDEATKAGTLTEAVNILRDPGFTPGESVLLEDHAMRTHPEFVPFLAPSAPAHPKKNSVTWRKNSHEYIELSVETDRDSILVLADTYYPGWSAAVDGVSVPILAANLSQRAIPVPRGMHTVTFTYTPMSLIYGSIISVTALLLIMFLAVVRIPFGASHIQKTAPPPASHRRSTRRRP